MIQLKLLRMRINSCKVRGNLREMGVGIYTGYRAIQIPSEVRYRGQPTQI